MEIQPYRFSDLLPYTQEVQFTSLKDRLRLLYLLDFMYTSAEEALHDFFAGNYQSFDAQVSENLCQIRAYQLIQYIRSYKDSAPKLFAGYRTKLKSCRYSVSALRAQYQGFLKKRPSHYRKQIDASITLEQILQQFELDFEISELVFYLIQTYILSTNKLVANFHVSTGIDYKQLKERTAIDSNTYLRKVIHTLQRNISRLSCDFILNLERSHFANTEEKVLLALHQKDEVGRHLLPCYQLTKLLLADMLTMGVSAQIIVYHCDTNDAVNRVDSLLFVPTKNGWVLNNDSSMCSDAQSITFFGVASSSNNSIPSRQTYLNQFLGIGFELVVLANMAQHPQYAGSIPSSQKENPYEAAAKSKSVTLTERVKLNELEFLKHKASASLLGCSKNCSNLFLLTHVVCCEHAYSVLPIGNVNLSLREVEKAA